MQIGHYQIDSPLFLAPMAGVTDGPFRQLCIAKGAGIAVSEMISSDPSLRKSRKSQQRITHHAETGIRSVQIAGYDPHMMADAARYNAQKGAQIIDINMGCPAKKVCNKAAGSALLKDPELVEQILTHVVQAVDIPVTLKIRTGWSPDQRNGVAIARIAEQAGIRALAVHGRTRECRFKGNAEYDTIATIKQSVTIPVIANGDITSAEKAKFVLEYTGADGLMIGRGAQGNPWIFDQIQHYLTHSQHLAKPSLNEVWQTVRKHVQNMHAFYGDVMGVRISRKHVSWYLTNHSPDEAWRQQFNRIDTPVEQLDSLDQYFKSKDENVVI
ncbi:MAG: tRNA dihydrouridine synthase DusB [Kangiellaceae bacterium]|nr:tRNA dihydrouridine synthase DusB [Kangiellaceae bacterium]